MRRVELQGMLRCRELSWTTEDFPPQRKGAAIRISFPLPPPATQKRHDVTRLTLLNAASAPVVGRTSIAESPPRPLAAC